MSKLEIRVLGELAVRADGDPAELPASRKTRALLAYLALNPRPQRRDRLCELLWEIPDDPRAALRWSLSKLRPIINDAGTERLLADRERVWLDEPQLQIDLVELRHKLESSNLSREALLQIAEALAQPLLEGLELEEQPLFQRWLIAEREETQRLRGSVHGRLARHPATDLRRAVLHARRWVEDDPFNPEAGTILLSKLRQTSNRKEAEQVEIQLAERFRQAGIPWNPARPAVRLKDPPSLQRQLLMQQRIHFCTAADGVRIAYAEVGQGPPLVKAANWLSHLEYDWEAIWAPLFEELAREHTFIRYDERGNGLSDWNVDELSFETFVTDLETVIDAMELERFALLGISQGASVSIEYASRHPDKVSHLILWGGYAAGWRIDASEQAIREREAVMTLTETGWGRDDPVYRQIFSSTFMPGATPEELHRFNEFQRQTTSPENAVRFQSAFGDIDVRHRLAEVRVPTMVLHAKGDRRVPFATGREIAASIPGAEFVPLESDNHLLLGREPASQVLIDQVRRFLG